MDLLTRYMIFFLACMTAIVLLTYIPDRGDKRSNRGSIPCIRSRTSGEPSWPPKLL